MSIAEHNAKLVKAIEFKNDNPIYNENSDDNDSNNEEEGRKSETEVAYFPEIPVQCTKGRKFDGWDGSYDGEELSYIEVANNVNVQLSNGDEEQFIVDKYKRHAQAASIPIGGIVYKFVEPFIVEGSNSLQPFNGKVVSIRSDGKRVCKYNVGANNFIQSLDRIKDLSDLHLGNSEDEESYEEKVPYSTPPTKEKATSGKCFKKL